ncbi:MAG: prolipoprotein diacylglyceryl transferase [Chloroflexota bacterium]
MGPIVIGIDPVIFSVGPFSLHWYGLAIGAGIAVGFYVALREARRRGIDEDEIYSLGLWAVVAAFVGARLFHVADHWGYYQANPGAILAIQNGGLAIYGGIIGGAVAALLYAIRHRLSFPRIADVAAPALILGQAIGRVGCTITGDAVGGPTNLPWGFVYTNPHAMAPSLGVAYHPAQLYEMLWDLLVFAFLWRARDRLRPDGMLFLSYLSLYSVGKFAITFSRQEAVLFLGLQEAQIVALLVLAFSLPLMVLLATGNMPRALQEHAS